MNPATGSPSVSDPPVIHMENLRDIKYQNDETEVDLVLYLEPRLVERIQRLVDTPELGFSQIGAFIRTALYSFVAYKERLVRQMGGRP